MSFILTTTSSCSDESQSRSLPSSLLKMVLFWYGVVLGQSGQVVVIITCPSPSPFPSSLLDYDAVSTTTMAFLSKSFPRVWQFFFRFFCFGGLAVCTPRIGNGGKRTYFFLFWGFGWSGDSGWICLGGGFLGWA